IRGLLQCFTGNIGKNSKFSEHGKLCLRTVGQAATTLDNQPFNFSLIFANLAKYPALFLFAVSFLPFGLPKVVPEALTRLNPSFVLSEISERSNSAKAERI